MYFLHAHQTNIGLFQNTQADPRSVKWSAKRLRRGTRPHHYCTISPTVPPSSCPHPLWSPWPGRAPSAGQGWMPLDPSWGEIDGANNYATLFLNHPSCNPHRNVLHEGPQGGYISHGKLKWTSSLPLENILLYTPDTPCSALCVSFNVAIKVSSG